MFGDVGRRARCRAELVNVDDDGAGILGRVTLMDDAGTPTAELTGIYLQRVQRRTVPLPLTQKIFDTTWVDTSTPTSPEPPAPPEGSWLVLTDGAETEEIANDFINQIRLTDPTSDQRGHFAMSPRCWRPSRKPRQIPSFRRSG